MNKFIFSIILLCIILKAKAYDKNGHQKIESKAYEIFAKLPATADHPSGQEMLKVLIEKGFIDRRLEPKSSFPDLSLERQFAQDKQMYHFMASNKAVFDAAKLSNKEEQQHNLLIHSLPDCLKMMYYFYRESINNTPSASQSGRGIHVLIHIVEDSYSAEHTTRDPINFKLVTIKGWQLSPRIKHWPCEAKAHDSGKLMRLLHTSAGEGDKDYMDTIRLGELTPLANAAANSVSDLLLATYKGAINKDQADYYITDFFKDKFQPINSKIVGKQFVFTYKDTISFDYEADFQPQKHYVAFNYDRFPRHAIMFSSSINFTNTPVFTSYGIEYQKFNTPLAADNSKAILKRLPWAWGLSVNKITTYSSNNYEDMLKLKFFLKTVLTLPLCNWEPYGGAGTIPSGYNTHTNFILGSDFSISPFNDMFKDHVPIKLRLSAGYEHDFSGQPNRNSIMLKLGFNTWQSRFEINSKKPE